MPEVVTILTVIIVSVLAIERIASRIKESKCSNCVEIKFKDSKSNLKRSLSLQNLPELLKTDKQNVEV
jgi:hypothetical protein